MRWVALTCLLASGCAMTAPGITLAVGRGSVVKTAAKTEVHANVRGVEILGQLSDSELLDLIMRLVAEVQQAPEAQQRLARTGPWEDRP